MKGYLVDTNVLLRLLTEDDAGQTPAAKLFFESVVAGKAKAYLTVATLLELVWTLESYFQVPRRQVAEKLDLVLNTPNLAVENQVLVERCVEYYRSSKADFADCYNASFAAIKGDGSVLSYDRHFDKLEGVRRVEPGAIHS